MNLKNLATVIKSVSDSIEKNEQLLLPSLAIRAKKAAENYPYDSSLVMASQVLSKMAESKPFITKAEFESMYHKLTSSSSLLGEVFAEELGRKEQKSTVKTYNRAGEGTALNDYEVVADPVLANALKSAFDGSGEYKLYSQASAERAERICQAGLLEVGLPAKKVSVFCGQEDLILCQASYETPKGLCNVIVPIEIKNGSALMPTIFLGVNAFVDLQPETLKAHVLATAGKSYHVDGEGILRVLSTAKNGVKKIASEVDMAAIRIKAAKGDSSMLFDMNGIVGMKVADPVEAYKEPEAEKTQEHFDFAKRVTSPDGAARFIHGDKLVEAGRNVVTSKLVEFGYRHPQVKVADFSEKQIKYAVSIGVNSAIMAYVDVTSGAAIPKIAIASGEIRDFTAEGIKDLFENTKPDTRALAASSMSSGLKSSELVQQVRDAVNEGNLLKAEDAINVLGERDKQAQKVAIAILLTALSPQENRNEVQVKTAELAGKKVLDVPIFNNYRIFYPED